MKVVTRVFHLILDIYMTVVYRCTNLVVFVKILLFVSMCIQNFLCCL